jgi:hypothetical protein
VFRIKNVHRQKDLGPSDSNEYNAARGWHTQIQNPVSIHLTGMRRVGRPSPQLP